MTNKKKFTSNLLLYKNKDKKKKVIVTSETTNLDQSECTEEVGQAGRKASWVRVSNSARDFIHSMAVVE